MFLLFFINCNSSYWSGSDSETNTEPGRNIPSYSLASIVFEEGTNNNYGFDANGKSSDSYISIRKTDYSGTYKTDFKAVLKDFSYGAMVNSDYNIFIDGGNQHLSNGRNTVQFCCNAIGDWSIPI